MLSRRGALRGLFFAAPAIVAAPSLMRVSASVLDSLAASLAPTPQYNISELITATLRARTPQLIANVTKNNAILQMMMERQTGVTPFMLGRAA